MPSQKPYTPQKQQTKHYDFVDKRRITQNIGLERKISQ